LVSFEVHLVQKIQVPTFSSGVTLNRSQNTATVPIYSNVDFMTTLIDPSTSHVLNQYEQPLKLSVQKAPDNLKGSNAYYLKLSITMESEDRQWVIEMKHPTSGQVVRLPVHYYNTQAAGSAT
jgi:hypothetical protein